MGLRNTDAALKRAVTLVGRRCPRLVATCYWAGTSAVATEELHHRRSFDLDFHTRKALADVRPLLAEIQAAFPGKFRLLEAPDAFGSGFTGTLALPRGGRITIQVLANYEDVADRDLVPSSTVQGLLRVRVERYLADKIQCVVERLEARDLVDIHAVLTRFPALVRKGQKLVAEQDALLLVERLQAWTPASLRRDLAAYKDTDASEALRARDLLLMWAKESKA